MTPWDIILILAAAFLIPLLPAFLLYKFLPSDASISGRLKALPEHLQRVMGSWEGVTVKATGAFAGYVILVAAAFIFVDRVRVDPDVYPKYEEFELVGSVALPDNNIGNAAAEFDRRNVELFFHPRRERVEGLFQGQRFEWATTVPVRRNFDGSIEYPFQAVIISYPGHFPEKLNLRSLEAQETEGGLNLGEVELKPSVTDRTVAREVELQ